MDLFSPYELRGVTFANRIAVSPMSQYRAERGEVNDWHLVHLGRFALGRAGLVFTEATAVTEAGRRTHGDLGLWNDEQVDGLARVLAFIEREGSVPGVQLGHAGRKASERRPWHGETPVDDDDRELRGEAPWPAIAPSALPYADGWPTPVDMTDDHIAETIEAFGLAARRARDAGAKIIEVYAAHGFLIHQFLSPIANHRGDRWGGSAANRNRFAVEVAHSIRAHWPEDLPLSFRLSATDWVDGGIEVSDSVETARELKAAGVDMIDCSTGGIGGRERPVRMNIEEGFQVPFARRIRADADIATTAVGFLWDPQYCDSVISDGSADMVALAREILDDPNWSLHAEATLGAGDGHASWPEEAGWWLAKRARLIERLGLRD